MFVGLGTLALVAACSSRREPPQLSSPPEPDESRAEAPKTGDREEVVEARPTPWVMPEPEDRQEPVEEMLLVENRVYALASGRLYLVDIDENALGRVEVPCPGRVIDIAKIESALAVLTDLRGVLGFAILRGDTWTTVPSPGKVAARVHPVLIPWRDSMLVFTDSRIWKLKGGGWDAIDIPYMYTVDRTLNHYWRVKSLPHFIHATHGDLLFVGWDKGEFGKGVVALDLDAEEKTWRRIAENEIASEENRLPGDWQFGVFFNPRGFRQGPDGKLWMLTSFAHLSGRHKSIFRFDGNRWERVKLPADLSGQPHIRKLVERQKQTGSRSMPRLETYYVTRFCFAPDGTPYLNTNSRGVYALKDGSLELVFYCTRVYGPMVVDRKRTVTVGTRSRGILVLERDGEGYTPRIISTAREEAPGWGGRDWMELPHREGVEEVVFSPDGQVLATASYDGTVSFWEVATGLKARTVKAHPYRSEYMPEKVYPRRICCLAFAPDGRHVASGGRDETAALIEIGADEVVRRFHDRGSVYDLTFSPDNLHLLTASGDGVTVWRLDSTVPKGKYSGGSRPCCYTVAVSPCGRYVAGGGYQHAWLWDFRTRRKLRTFDTLRVNYTVFSLAFSPDSKQLAAGCDGNNAIIWDVESGERIMVFEGHMEGVGCVRFSPDGRWLATAGRDRTAGLWDVESGAEVHTFVGHSAALRSVAFSPDGSLLATGSADGTARVWRLPDRFQSGRPEREF
jgi:WD40 repeat protein